MSDASATSAAAPGRSTRSHGRQLDPDEAARSGVRSDDEDGPDDPDDELDAEPIGGLPDYDAPPLADEVTAPLIAPELPPDISTCTGAQLKLHCWWRKLSTIGKKDALKATLQTGASASATG